jgi:hypothetical protein
VSITFGTGIVSVPTVVSRTVITFIAVADTGWAARLATPVAHPVVRSDTALKGCTSAVATAAGYMAASTAAVTLARPVVVMVVTSLANTAAVGSATCATPVTAACRADVLLE